MTFNSVGDRRSVYTERIKMMRWGIGKVVPTVYALRQSRCSKKNESNTNELHQQTSRYIERKSYISPVWILYAFLIFIVFLTKSAGGVLNSAGFKIAIHLLHLTLYRS